ERGLIAPDGLFGGREGGKFAASVTRTDGSRQDIPSKGEYVVVHTDDIVRIRPAAGGGYGSPLEREPERVLEGVLDGYVSAEAAFVLYVVFMRADVTRIDFGDTEAR